MHTMFDRRKFLTAAAAGVSLNGWLGRLAAAAPAGLTRPECPCGPNFPWRCPCGRGGMPDAP